MIDVIKRNNPWECTASDINPGVYETYLSLSLGKCGLTDELKESSQISLRSPHKLIRDNCFRCC